ncbi:unnamed protein product [Rangifer tarandus platyrhynchus]|uniref:Uncharacterized protein n=1 Tax=Rangifer tarandus platyrhynchus TaxID=3082113 RepID=A0AC60A6E2_RANTA
MPGAAQGQGSQLLSDANSNRTPHATREACDVRLPPAGRHGSTLVSRGSAAGDPGLTWLANKAPGIPVELRRDQLPAPRCLHLPWCSSG